MGIRRKKAVKTERQTLLQKLSLLFYDNPRIVAVFFLIIFAFGIASYTTLLKREGFPSVSIPYSIVTGSYLVNDAERVDKEVAKPLSDVITKVDGVKCVNESSLKDSGDCAKFVRTQSTANSFVVIVQYNSDITSEGGSKLIEDAVKEADVLPSQAQVTFRPVAFGPTDRGDDILIAFSSKDNSASLTDLTTQADKAAQFLKESGKIPLAENISIIDQFARGVNPLTGKQETSQIGFDRFVLREDGQEAQSFRSVTIGIKGQKGFDVLELDKQVRAGLDQLENESSFSAYRADFSYGLAPQIDDQINELQKALLEGLIAVMVFSAILIALRASFINVAAMVMVLATTTGLLYLIDYTLNTITLFALILALSLIVDDTIIMVEAIDAQRRRLKDGREIISVAIKKISRAMLAATFTAGIGFAPLIFVSGILGSFIRAIPITIISSLFISLLLALTFIPFLSRFVLLRPKQLEQAYHEQSLVARVEQKIVAFLLKPLRWAQHHRKREWGVGLAAVLIGLGFIFAGGMIFRHVTFNIFPPTKDTNELSVTLTYAAGTDIIKAEAVADQANSLTIKALGNNMERIAYFSNANPRSVTMQIQLVDFKKRKPLSGELVKTLQNTYDSELNGARAKVGQLDVGPPASPFTLLVKADDVKNAQMLANDVSDFLSSTELKRPDGSIARMKNATVADPAIVTRDNGKRYLSVSAEFDGTDTTTLVTLAQDAVKAKFTEEKLSKYGLDQSSIVFDIGQEAENQESFKTMVIAFPLLLLGVYLLLSFQFRSLLQPLLIFMAIPFSFFGITLILLVSNNAFSFFTMMGFFALMGLSIKNTILLTDYANQAQRSGEPPIDAIATSLKERFRPLVATSLVAVVSLIPLALSNPFWEGLALTLMFGLLSSTLLVVTVFPYYYLGGEYMRLKTRSLFRRLRRA